MPLKFFSHFLDVTIRTHIPESSWASLATKTTITGCLKRSLLSPLKLEGENGRRIGTEYFLLETHGLGEVGRWRIALHHPSFVYGPVFGSVSRWSLSLGCGLGHELALADCQRWLSFLGLVSSEPTAWFPVVFCLEY